ncbi:MAG: pentapeptide repeat-containing protein [Chitinophagaceae bacterium]|nr:MAG: pentapeptide repeat-containing protein [Chitinophagaceae bacterium]
MGGKFTEDQKFNGIDYTKEKFETGEYEYCEFNNCNFAGVNLSDSNFVECIFTGCNITNCKVTNVTFNNVKFVESKVIGINFENCNEFLFSVSFDNCTLNFSSFYKRSLKKTVFDHSVLQETDFTDADLSGSSFNKCNLHLTKFENTNLEKADFRTSFNYALNPEQNKIKKAKFSIDGLAGLLVKYDIVVS